MLFTRFIPRSCVVAKLEVSSRSQAIESLCELLMRRKHQAELLPLALERLLAREATQNTSVGHGLAIPHAPVAGLPTLMCAVGRVPGGLDYQAVDGEPVQLIFLICYPPAAQTLYLNVLGDIASLLREEKIRGELIEAGTTRAILAILTAFAETLHRPEEGVSSAADLPASGGGPAALLLLARLELLSEMLKEAPSGKRQIEQRLQNLRALLDPKLLAHYQQLERGGRRALVAVEGGVCQGCHRQLPAQLAQRVRQERERVFTCSSCNRFVYSI